MEKYCVDCNSFKGSKFGNWCANPKLGKSLVTGETDRQLASIARRTQCMGNWFEEKEILLIKNKWYQRLFKMK